MRAGRAVAILVVRVDSFISTLAERYLLFSSRSHHHDPRARAGGLLFPGSMKSGTASQIRSHVFSAERSPAHVFEMDDALPARS